MIETKEAKKLFFDYPIDSLVVAYMSDEPHEIISEIADSNVDIYNDDLLEWLKKNYTVFNDSVSEFDFAKDSEGKPDLMKAIMVGQYYGNEQELWSAWNEIKEYIDGELESAGLEKSEENVKHFLELLQKEL